MFRNLNFFFFRYRYLHFNLLFSECGAQSDILLFFLSIGLYFGAICLLFQWVLKVHNKSSCTVRHREVIGLYNYFDSLSALISRLNFFRLGRPKKRSCFIRPSKGRKAYTHRTLSLIICSILISWNVQCIPSFQ